MDKPEYICNEWNRLNNEKTFKSDEERDIFFKKLNKEPITLVNKQPQTAEDYAKCLALIAYEVSPEEGFEYAKKALAIDPECIDAYSFLGGVEPDNKKRLLLYQKGITIGKKKFSPEYFKENRGFFYTLTETIPFMNCLHFYGGTLAD
jgi:hypothetical protein